jgi:hypothetical protein
MHKISFSFITIYYYLTVYCVLCREPVVLLLLVRIRLQRWIPWCSLELLGEEGPRLRYVLVHLFPERITSSLVPYMYCSHDRSFPIKTRFS